MGIARDIRLDENGDLDISTGDLGLVEDAQAIIQRIPQALKLFLGEWYLDTTQGTPWFQDVLVKNPNPDIIRSVIRNRILSVAGVKDVVSMILSYVGQTRKLTAAYQAETDVGLLADTIALGGT